MSREYVERRLAEIKAEQPKRRASKRDQKPRGRQVVKLAEFDQRVEPVPGKPLRLVVANDWIRKPSLELESNPAYLRNMNGPLPNIQPPRLHADAWAAPPMSISAVPGILKFRRIDLGACRPGVYFLFLEGQMQYIGSSIDVRARVTTHQEERRIRFDFATYLPTPSPWHLAIEALYIAYHRPPHNSMFCD